MGKGTIMIEPCAGLGNRLLALTSAYELSKKLDKELTVMETGDRLCDRSKGSV